MKPALHRLHALGAIAGVLGGSLLPARAHPQLQRLQTQQLRSSGTEHSNRGK
jgi:hypothetical protein